MDPFSNKLKLKLFIARRTLGYTYDYVERLYKIYLNHSKVIHFRDGYPVFSLTTPALFSKPSANFFARSLYRSIQNKNLPNLMSFAVNDICNAACEHCSFFTAIDDKTRKTMNLEQCKKVISNAQELGVSVFNFVGGEPLMRKDLPSIIGSVDKDISSTVLFTNGWFLVERARELRRAGLDSVYISIDSAENDMHDNFRHKKGLFERAIKGIAEAKRLGMSTGISCTITPESYAGGEFDKIVELGKKIGIHEVLAFDALPAGRYKKRADLTTEATWIDELIRSAKRYSEMDGYPGVIAHAYMTSHMSVGCSCGTSYFYVSPYGDITSCDFNSVKVGNVLKEPLYRIWDRLSSSESYGSAKWGGCKVKDSTFKREIAPALSADAPAACAGCSGCGEH